MPLPKDLRSFQVNHLPVVTSFMQKIGLLDTLNGLVDSQRQTDPGTMVSALVLNTLCGRSPLYHLEQFFQTQDTELLFGRNIQASCFNDDAAGRALDDLHQAGIDLLFSSVSLEACRRLKVDCSTGHFDTTSVNVWGDYQCCQAKPKELQLNHGHSKDHRPDLKQFVFSLLCVEGNIPLMGLPHDGNSADTKLNNQQLMRVSQLIKDHPLEEQPFTYIADCKLVTSENLQRLDSTRFITRLPASYKAHDQVIEQTVKADQWIEIGELAPRQSKNRPPAHYQYSEQKIQLYDQEYRAIVIHSSAHDQRRLKRIERKIGEDRKGAEKEVASVSKRVFACEADARGELSRLESLRLNYHRLEPKVEEVPVYGAGRPAQGKPRVPLRLNYRVTCAIQPDSQAMESKRSQAGCFVLLTNVPSQGEEAMDGPNVLRAYKDQHGVETSFRFLKDPLIVNDLFLKKPERIEALGMVLMLSLLVWNLIERTLRQYIEENQTTLPGWDKKQTTKPTTYMLTWMFTGIIVIRWGAQRRLGNPLQFKTLEYLEALGLNALIFITPPSLNRKT